MGKSNKNKSASSAAASGSEAGKNEQPEGQAGAGPALEAAAAPQAQEDHANAIQQLQEQLEAAKTANAQLEAQQQDQQQRADAAKRDLEAMQADLAAAEGTRDEQIAKNEQITASLAVANKAAAEAESQLAQIKAEKEAAETAVREAREALVAAQAKMQSVNQENITLQTQLEASEKQTDAKQVEIENLKSALVAARAEAQQRAFDPFDQQDRARPKARVSDDEDKDFELKVEEGDSKSYGRRQHQYDRDDRADFQAGQLYKTVDKHDVVASSNAALTYFDVDATIDALIQKIIDGINKRKAAEAQSAANDDGSEVPAIIELVTRDQLFANDTGEYSTYIEMLTTARAKMEELNNATRKLRDELATPHKDMEPGNVQAIADAQRTMIGTIAAELSKPITNDIDSAEPKVQLAERKEAIKQETETFKETYNANFPQIKGDRLKSGGWGVGVGLAAAALGAGLAFLAFFTLPMVFVGLDIALFSDVVFITLGSAAGALGLGGGIWSGLSANQNRYAHGKDTTRGAASNEKEAAKSTAMILNGLDFDAIRATTKKMGVDEPSAPPKTQGGYEEVPQDDGKKSERHSGSADSNDIIDVEKVSLRKRAAALWDSLGTAKSGQEVEEIQGDKPAEKGWFASFRDRLPTAPWNKASEKGVVAGQNQQQQPGGEGESFGPGGN